MIHTHFVLTEFLNVKTDVRRQALKCEPHSALLLLQLHILGNPQSVQPGITTKQAGRPQGVHPGAGTLQRQAHTVGSETPDSKPWVTMQCTLHL